MRWLLPVVAAVALSGCLQSETSVGSDHDHCWILCGEQSDTHVHFDFTPVLVMLLVVGLIVGIIIAAASGRDGGQQQVVVYIDKDQKPPL